MIRMNNDYSYVAHPNIIKAIQQASEEGQPGYGLDDWCNKASEEIKKYLSNPSAEIHYMLGGTQVNFTVIAAALRPHQGVISAVNAHINNHETGARSEERRVGKEGKL